MSAVDKIRVAVLTRGDSLESWEIAALEAVKKLPFAEIVLEIRDSSSSSIGSGQSDKVGSSVVNKIARYRWKRLLWNKWFKKYGKVNATKEVSASEIFQNVPRIDVVPELKGKFSQHFSPGDIAKVKEHNPDVIIRFGFNILRGEILTVAKHGVWSYHHADHEIIRGGPAGFWEYMLGEHHTGAILQRLTEKLDDGVVLRKGYWALVKHSFRENLDSLLMNSSGWIANALTELHHHGTVRPQNPEKSSNAKVYSYPGNLRMLGFWSVLIANKIAFHWNNLFQPETWKIGIVNQPLNDVVANGIAKDIRWIEAPRGDSYYADPFTYNNDGVPVVLCEHFDGKEQRSRIVYPEDHIDVYHPETHVSFPGIVAVNDQQYILPESSASGKCELVNIRNVEEKILLSNEPLVDPVLVEHNNLWWLFAHKLNDQNNAALFVYYSDSPTGEFAPHALNPVKTDIRNSRGAGEIFMHNGKLIRPAQDSAVTYGKAIVLNEIVDLTPASFLERAIGRIEADPMWEYDKGIHTINACGNKTLIDAKSFRFNFANFKAQFSRKARRITGK